MFGWSIRARACRSASKRAITCRVSMPGLRTFRATLRRTGCVLLGHEDDAEAALADLLQQLVRADRPCRGVRVTGWSIVRVTPGAGTVRGSCRRARAAASRASTRRQCGPVPAAGLVAGRLAPRSGSGDVQGGVEDRLVVGS